MGIVESLSQLVKMLPNENLEAKAIEKKIEQAIPRFKNTYIEIWDENAEPLFTEEIPSDKEEDVEPYLKELKEVLRENYVIPNNPKGGHLGILGEIEIYSGQPALTDKKREKLTRRFKKYVQEGKIKLAPENILKKVEEIFNQHNKRKILIVLRPRDEKIKEIKSKVEEMIKGKEKITCMLCHSSEYASTAGEISKVLPWLVSKNIAFVYNHCESKYHENLPICSKCIERLRGSEYISLDKAFRFLNYNFKVFPEAIKENGITVKNIWDYLTTSMNMCFDDVINTLPIKTLKPEVYLFNIWIYRKMETNKVDVIDQIENVRLIELMEVYRIFKEWKNENEERKGERIVDKNSLLKVLLQEEGKTKVNLDLVLQILNKLLRKEKIDRNIYMRIMNIFDKLSQKYLYTKDEEQLQKLFKLVDFIDFYNKNI